METYIPKYTSAFLNIHSKTDSGEMYFGISDDGFVHGIPYQGELDEDMIRAKVHSILDSELINSEYDLKKFVDVEVIKVDTTDFTFNESHNKIIEDYFSKKRISRKVGEISCQEEKWVHMMQYYGDKLHTLLNERYTRYELLQYIILKSPNSKEIHRLLRSNYQFEAIPGDEIAVLKEDTSTIWYWLTRWKDDMSDFVKTLKPYPPPGISNSIYPHNIITTIVDMIPRWLNHSSNNINLYLIKFSFHKPKIDLDITYQGTNGEYIYCYRSMLDNGPFCQPC